MLFIATYLTVGYDVLKRAGLGIINLKLFNESFLMAIATVGAFALAIVERSGDYNEAVAVMLLYQTGELFQSIAVGKSRRSIASLMDIRPDVANIEQDGRVVSVAAESIEVGTVIWVNPGEKIAIDGIVIQGNSSLDTSALTGESMPRAISVGDEVQSGSVNLDGLLKIRTVKEFGNSTASKILELVENAAARKSHSERFISRFARIYTPLVCLFALLLAVIPPVLLPLFSVNTSFTVWLYRALTFLVISCPCALVISVPLAFFAAIGTASRMGILIKGSGYIELLSRLECIAFDKTGTLTCGKFGIKDIITSEHISKEELLEYAAHAESSSVHPIGKCIKEAYGKPVKFNEVSCVKELAGEGVTAIYNGKSIAAGNERLMLSLGIPCPKLSYVGTSVLVAVDNEYAGAIILSDIVKSDAKEVIEELKLLGVSKTVILSGDKSAVVEEVKRELNLNEAHSELLPLGKVDALESIIDGTKGSVAYVGDGINDAPVLARADVGISMGALGSDAAIEASDTVIMNDELKKVAKAVKISKSCMRIVKENIAFSIGIKVLCLALVTLGLADMWLGIFADVGVMMLAILNSLRMFISKNS